MFSNTTTFRLCLLGATAALLSLGACKKDDDPVTPAVTTNSIHIELEHLAPNGSDSVLVLRRAYTDSLGNRYYVKQFQYFISNVQLTRADGTIWEEPHSYHLIQVEGAPNENPELELKNVPQGNYTKVSFGIGVDPIANSRTDQASGDLNPTGDMVWDWNTGYIFFKMEGRQLVNPAPDTTTEVITINAGKTLSYRPVTLTLPEAATVTAEIAPEAHTYVSVAKLFSGGVNNIVLDGTGFFATQDSQDAQRVADNYATMFRVGHVHNEHHH